VKLPRLRRRAPTPATVTAERTTEEWVSEPMGDHSHDCDGWLDEPRPFVISPYMTRTAAELAYMSGERRAILAESESRDGWPARWDPLIEAVGGWIGFQTLVARLYENAEQRGIGIDAQLVDLEHELDLCGFDLGGILTVSFHSA
jgi:hypothetical protein